MSTTSIIIPNHLDTLAVFTGGLFAGTALYMLIGEVPALREFGLNEFWNFFPFLYKRAVISQPVLTAISTLTAIVHGARIESSTFDRNLWFAAGSIFLAMMVFTKICIVPINQKILDDNKSVKSGKESKISTTRKKELLDKWAHFHLIRTIGAVTVFGAMVFGLSRRSSLVLRW